MTDDPIVIKNLKYWGVPRNDGFLMMPNEVEAYRAGDKPFEFKGTNGFMITIDITRRRFEKGRRLTRNDGFPAVDRFFIAAQV